MDENNPGNSGFGTAGTGYGTTGNVGGGTIGSGTGTTGTTGATGGTTFGTSGTGTTGVGADAELCPHCGQALNRGGLEQFLGRLGITNDMINNLKTGWDNVDIDEYLNTAREYLRDGSNKATRFAKDNPGKVAAGVAVLALGAGLLYNAVRDKNEVEVEFTPDYDRK